MTPLMRRYVEGRLFEWVMAISMILLGIEIYLFPIILGAASFYLLIELIPGPFISCFLLVFGLMRLGALIANGRSTFYGPRLRSIGAIAGAVLWSQFALSLVTTFYTGPPSPGIPFWTMFVLAELYSAYRAETDARN